MALRRLWLGWQAIQLARTATAALPAHARAPVRAGVQVVALGVAAAACAGLAWLALLATIVLAIVGDGWWISLAVAGGLVAAALACGVLARARWRTARTVLDRP
ncbi:MAG: phage holin family protein [Thermoleophilia bacterium]